MIYLWEAMGIEYIMQSLGNLNVLQLGHADLF